MSSFTARASTLDGSATATNGKSMTVVGDFHLNSSGRLECVRTTLQKIQEGEPGVREELATGSRGDLARKLTTGPKHPELSSALDRRAERGFPTTIDGTFLSSDHCEAVTNLSAELR